MDGVKGTVTWELFGVVKSKNYLRFINLGIVFVSCTISMVQMNLFFFSRYDM